MSLRRRAASFASFLVRLVIPLLVAFIAIPLCFAATDYTVTLANPEEHLIDVRITLPQGAARRELQLPVWNALYQIRDFSQYVDWVRAKDRAGRPLMIRSLNSSEWEIEGAESGAVVEYQTFAGTGPPFGVQLDTHHAFFNLAQILMYPSDARNQPVIVRFGQLPKQWRLATPLQDAGDGSFSAPDYDRLVDSPVEIGTFQEADFEEGGAKYRVIVDADPGDYDMERITAMLRKIVAAATNWMSDRPFQTYMFLYHFPHGPAGGGMEHAYSTAISLNAEVVTRAPEVLASVTAHEFFHLWNVKRIRPQTLEPIDYTKANYTRALWFSEGCTNTAADFIELRAGLLDEKTFEQELASDIGELERRPAKLTQSAEVSSLDAWLEGFPYYRAPERSVSYYNKGELLGIALDFAMRQASQGKASIRELFEWMNENYAKRGKFFPDSEGVREAAEAVAHTDLGWFFSKYVAGTEEIPWDDFFRIVGLHLVTGASEVADAGFVASRNFDAPMLVTQVKAGGPAETAGLQVGETILEINGVPPGLESSESVGLLSPGAAITVKIRERRGAERELKWQVGSRQETSYQLKDLDNVSQEQRLERAAWLKGEAEAAP